MKPTSENPAPELMPVNLFETQALIQPASSSQARIDENDNFYVSSFNNYGGNPPVLLCTYRVLLDDGRIIFGQEVHLCRIFTDYAEQISIFSPALRGILLSLSVQVQSETFRRGQVYVHVGLFQGTSSSTLNRKNVLISGYVATSYPLTYPGKFETPDEVKRFGYHGTFSGALPYYITPYATQDYEPYMIYVDYQTDGTAGDRRVFLELQDSGANTLGLFFSGVAQAASLTYYYIFSRRATNDSAIIQTGSSNSYVQCALPAFRIPRGGRIKVDCLNRQGTDSSSFARLTGFESVGL